MLLQKLTKRFDGFSLVEVLVVVAILGVLAAWGIPSLMRRSRQGEVDRYTQTVETGLFDLRSKLGTSKLSCEIEFPSVNQFKAPWELLEFRQPNGSLANQENIECCDSKDNCLNAPDYRIIRLEGTQDRNKVEVAVNQKYFQINPPGTSAESADLTVRIRSNDWDKGDVMKSDGSSRLLTRCIQVSGSGNIKRGTWNETSSTCQ